MSETQRIARRIDRIKENQRYHVTAVGLLFYCVICAIFIALVSLFFPSGMVLGIYFWADGSFTNLFRVIIENWIVFSFGICFSAFALWIKKNEPHQNWDPSGDLWADLFTGSLSAVSEELYFRWFRFIVSTILVGVMNWLLGGFMGFGLLKLLYDAVLIPFANFITYGQLGELLYHPAGWQVGAAIFACALQFGSGHKYQGLIGYLDALFFGFFQMLVCFQCGLPAAIFVHVVYNGVIAVLSYIDKKVERARGNV